MIGQEMGVSGWVEMTQERVNTFADVTGDHQWIHVDVERAKASPLGGPIAHGYLTLSMLPVLRRQDWRACSVDLGAKMAINYGLNRVRFISPVHVGKRIRLRTKLLSVDEVQPDVYQMISRNRRDRGQERPAMVAESIGPTTSRPVSPRDGPRLSRQRGAKRAGRASLVIAACSGRARWRWSGRRRTRASSRASSRTCSATAMRAPSSAVNPRYERVLDAPCYPSILDVPGALDLVVVGVATADPDHPGAVRAEGRRRARDRLQRLLRDGGAEGAQRQAELAAWAQRTGIPVGGPNCLGLMNMPIGHDGAADRRSSG